MLENSLASLYSRLMGITEDIAGITFFKINNARSRIAISERLLKKKHGDQYNHFWKSLSEHLGKLDETRNKIVHWATETHINVDLPPTQRVTSLKLAPPNFWDKTQATPDMTINELYEFIVKCDFITRLTNVFNWTANGNPYAPHMQISKADRDLCSQPIIYPPPDNHPLLLK